METRDIWILRHVARHGLSTKDVIQRTFFGTTSSSTVFTRLLKEQGYLTSEGRVLPSGYVYYQLTERGIVAVHQFEEARGKERRSYPTNHFSGQQLLERLAALWACHCDPKHRRVLVMPDELADLLKGSEPPHGLHCIQSGEKRCVLYRTYTPGPATEPSRVRDQAKLLVEGLLQHDACRRWIATRSYGLLILLHNQERQGAVRQLVYSSGLQERLSIQLGIAPTPETYASLLRS